MAAPRRQNKRQENERWEALRQLDEAVEKPLAALGFVWLLLLVGDLVWGLNRFLSLVASAIWIIFIIDFITEFWIAPRKASYLQHNWLTLFSLAVPALRMFRALQAIRLVRGLRVVRGLRLVRIVGSFNRGMRALGQTLGKRGFGYVAGLTLIVLLAGSAGMYALERGVLTDYGTALWWTSMLLLTLGTDIQPESAEGRILSVLLALYAFTMLGYITATLASFFIGRDVEEERAKPEGERSLRELKKEIADLREELRQQNSNPPE